MCIPTTRRQSLPLLPSRKVEHLPGVLLAVVAVVVVAVSEAAAQAPVRYTISFANRVHHEAEIEIVFEGIPSGPLQIRMSRTSPGRYRLHEFARNVYSFRAFDGRGRELSVSQPDPYGWEVGDHDGTVRVSYTLFADLVSGTYSAVDETHAHLNGPATFAWARGLENRSVEIRLIPAEASWRVATQLEPSDDPYLYRAPNLQYLLDSPIELSEHTVREWQVGEGERTQTFYLAMHHMGSDAEVGQYARRAQQVVAEATAVFGELPRFDYGTYTFLADYVPWASGDAMEHRNSTALTSSRGLPDTSLSLLTTLAHEFFHVWNVERLRPASLEPFDFEHVNVSGELWFAEGFTNYYDGLILTRAGLWTLAQWERDLSTIVDRIVNSPATQYGTPVDMSRLAAFRDRGQWVDPQNTDNTYLHYYFYGEALALALDLALLADFDTDLDAMMQRLWASHGRNEMPYTVDDLRSALAAIAEEDFAQWFFEEHVFASAVPDYRDLLSRAGFLVRRQRPREAWIGDGGLVFDKKGARLSSLATKGSPLYLAGIDRDDTLVSANGRRLRSAKTLDRLLAALEPGNTIDLVVEGRAGTRTVSLTLAENPSLEVVRSETAGTPLEASQRDLRHRWLASRSQR